MREASRIRGEGQSGPKYLFRETRRFVDDLMHRFTRRKLFQDQLNRDAGTGADGLTHQHRRI